MAHDSHSAERPAGKRPWRRKRPIRQVYFVEARALGLVKIGVATNAAKRIANLQVGSPDRLVLRGVIYTDDPHALERGYHATWAALRRHGEWFSVNQDLAMFMDEALWPADAKPPPARIILHPSRELLARRRGVVEFAISGWHRTFDEVMATIWREWTRTPHAPRLGS